MKMEQVLAKNGLCWRRSTKTTRMCEVFKESTQDRILAVWTEAPNPNQAFLVQKITEELFFENGRLGVNSIELLSQTIQPSNVISNLPKEFWPDFPFLSLSDGRFLADLTPKDIRKIISKNPRLVNRLGEEIVPGYKLKKKFQPEQTNEKLVNHIWRMGAAVNHENDWLHALNLLVRKKIVPVAIKQFLEEKKAEEMNVNEQSV